MSLGNYHFQKLTPISDADISVYEEAIDFVFENADLRNVAISGAYSAGKSSILESYKKKQREHKFVHISLTHFKSPDLDPNESKEPVKESVLEGKILNQLIHQIPAERIPQTNFRVKKGVSEKEIRCLTAFSVFFLGSFLYLLLSPKLASYIASLSDNWLKSVISVIFDPYGNIFAFIVFVICVIIFLYLIIKVQKNKNVFRKISLQGTEIEIFEEQDESYFDKYLNEVLYLFENVDANVVVFEDMDRFNANRIFERLREVNTLVNLQRKKKYGEDYIPLRFFYLLRDDIFVSKDRTKFFDFIIPVVPILDSSNSFEQFRIHLQEGNLLQFFDEGFLQSLSLYVDDMRILKNIYNEFVVYIYRLNTTDLDWNKMLGMIVFKNIFPRDFSDLQLNRGFVFSLFSKKQELIEKELSLENENKEKLLKRLSIAKSEVLDTHQELEDVYEAKINKIRMSGYSLKQEKSQLDQEKLDRKQAIEDRSEDAVANIKKEIANIEKRISKIQSRPLKDLITRNNSDEFFATSHTNEIGEINEFKEVKSSDYFPLLRFLIRNGFIDETYKDYMSYFYEGSLSTNDKTFLRRVTDRRGADWTFALNEPQKIVNSSILKSSDFEQEETLNFDLLEWLLLNMEISKNQAYIKTLFKQIRVTKNYKFVSKFLDTGKSHNQFVINLNKQWPEFFCSALEEKELSRSQLYQFSIDILLLSDPDILNAINHDNCLTNFISQSPEYLAIKQPNTKKLISRFTELKVAFISLDYKVSHKDLFNQVYENNLYDLNSENIELMLREQYGIHDQEEITHKNFSLIMSQGDSPLSLYVLRNIESYMETMLSSCNGKINDDQNAVISILNNDSIGIETKKRYIKLLGTQIPQLDSILETSLWTTLLDQKIVEFSIRNFVSYFQAHGFDDSLLNYLNEDPSNPDFSTVSKDFGDETAFTLFNTVAINNSVDNQKYKKILVDLNYKFENYKDAHIADDKFRILIDEQVLPMNLDSLQFIRDEYDHHLFDFIRKNFDEYLEMQTSSMFRLEEALEIITWDIEDSLKIQLLNLTNENISLINGEYSDEVNAYIIGHNLCSDEKQLVFENYPLYGEKAQAAIEKLVSESTQEIISSNMHVNNNLLSKLIQSDVLSHQEKVELFITSISKMDKENCKKHLNELGFEELIMVFDGGRGRRNYIKNDNISRILDEFKHNGWIYDYRDDERNNEKLMIIKNKPRGK